MLACATALTAQPEGGEVSAWPAPPEALAAQIDGCLAGGPFAAVKLGILAQPELVSVVLERLLRLPPVPVVVDPVLATSTGAPLFTGSRRAAYRELARARPVFTPNLPELAILAGGGEPARDEATALVPDEMVLLTNLIGTEAMVRDRVRAHKAAGVDTISVAPAGHTLAERIENLARVVEMVKAEG